jgi:hypothetical protein
VPAKINGFSLAYTAVGGVVLWSGIKGETLSETFRGLLSGKAPSIKQEPITGPAASAGAAGSGASPVTAYAPSAELPGGTAGGGTPAANKALGAVLAAGYGWGPGSKDWPYLESGWEEESGWNQYAANVPSDPYDNAYGIPQANPGTKMASAGSGWKTDPATQIRWGLGYIKSTYGSPSQVPGWTPDGPAAGYVGY